MLYTSEVTGKSYKTVKELEAAEVEFNKAHEAELKAKEERKVAATEVEKAYTAVLNARKEAKAIVDKANKEASDLIRKSELDYQKLKDEFIKKFGSYHVSYTNNNGKEVVTVSDLFDSFNSIFNSFWF